MPDEVVDLEQIRALRDFENDEKVAYIEALWGKHTFAVHACIRDMERMRRGIEDDGSLRDPETVYEGELLISHLRSLANFLARKWGLEHMIHPGDWFGEKENPDGS